MTLMSFSILPMWLTEKSSDFINFVLDNPVFCLVAFVIIFSALMVVTLKNIFHCALFLILALFGVAGIFILLHAEFLAAVQILLYVGAVSILMIFAIMLTSQLASTKMEQSNRNVALGMVIGIVMIMVFGKAFEETVWYLSDKTLPADNIFTLGKSLMTTYVLPFEVVSILLLAALIGAVVLARREKS